MIRVRAGELPTQVDAAERALLDADAGIYQRGGELVRPARVDTVADDDDDRQVRRAAGSLVLLPVVDSWLLEALCRAEDWGRYNKKREAWVHCDPPPAVARTLLARSGAWHFPVLRAVVTCPTLDAEARAIQVPGYDARSGLLLDVDDEWPTVADNPTKDEALAALQLLASPLRAMPWANAESRSVALSAMLTALVRSSLRAAPLHAFDSPTAGTGKSKIADVVGALKVGAPLPAMSQGKTDEEDEKRLSTVLHYGDPVLLIDNCERPLSGDFLCSMLTQTTVQARILGQSERRVLPSTALVLASGNNLVTSGDTSRRTVVCRIDAGVERPDERQFDFDPVTEALDRRRELVAAGLTALRAYHVAGRPEALTPMGSFEDWDWVRGTLVWLGEADPAASREHIIESDSRRADLVQVMDLWEADWGPEPVELSEIPSAAGDRPLEQKLIEVASKSRQWDARRVSWWLRRHLDRVVGGRVFRQDTSRTRTAWYLEGAQPLEPGARDDREPF